MKKKSYKDLLVWQRAVDLAETVYHATENFPKREHLGLASQIRKSAISIAPNIAEGSARHSNREFIQFLIIARGSSAELQTQMLVSHRMNFIKREDYMLISNMVNEIGKMMNGLKTSLTKD